MLVRQSQQQAQSNQIKSDNKIFIQSISSYIQIEKKLNQLSPLEVEEEILTDYSINQYDLTLEQINHDLAMCREFEGN